MKYLLLADIHGNIFALEECMKRLSKDDFDEIIFLGDYVSDVPRSHEVIEYIRKNYNDKSPFVSNGLL